jgi:hypothetical protein
MNPTPSVSRLLKDLDKACTQLKAAQHRRDTLILTLIDAKVPLRTIANHSNVSHQTIHNMATWHRENQ